MNLQKLDDKFLHFFFLLFIKVWKLSLNTKTLSDCLEVWYTERQNKGTSWYQIWFQYHKWSQSYKLLFAKNITNMWPDLRKPDNLPNKMYALTKFQLDMPLALGVMALQSGIIKKIDLYSNHWENKLQVLTKMDATYEWNVTRSFNLHHRVRHEQGHLFAGKVFPCITFLHHV